MVACFVAACKPAATNDYAQGTLVVLSYTFDAETVYWPTADAF